VITQDATTNPSLILAAAGKSDYQRLIDVAVKYGKDKGGDVDTQVNAAMDRLVSPFRVHRPLPNPIRNAAPARTSHSESPTFYSRT
jgi:transaldolase